MKKITFFRYLVVLGTIIATAVLYPKLPEIIPVHWNYEGQPDNWGQKVWGAWLIPGLLLVFLAFFPLLSRIDPKKENYQAFKNSWEVLQAVIITAMAYFHGVSLYIILNPDQSFLMGKLMFIGVGVMFVVLGNLLGKIRQNYFVGIKTPWTLDNSEVWQKTQRFGGWLFVVGGLIFLIEAMIWQYVLPIFIAVVAILVLAPLVYSYLLSRK